MLGLLDSARLVHIWCIGSVTGGMLGMQFFSYSGICVSALFFGSLVLLVGGMAAWFASLPVGLSSGVLALLFPFSFLKPLSRSSIRLLAGCSAWVFFLRSQTCEAVCLMRLWCLRYFFSSITMGLVLQTVKWRRENF